MNLLLCRQGTFKASLHIFSHILSHQHQEKNLKLLLICSKTYSGLILKSFQSILLQQTSHFRHKSSAFSPPLAVMYLKSLSPPGYIALPPTPFCSNELINASLRNKCCDARSSLISWIEWRRYLRVFQREMSLLLPDVIASQLVAGCAKSKVKVGNNTNSTLKHKHRQIPLSENILKHFPGKPRKTL